MAPNPRYSGGS